MPKHEITTNYRGPLGRNGQDVRVVRVKNPDALYATFPAVAEKVESEHPGSVVTGGASRPLDEERPAGA